MIETEVNACQREVSFIGTREALISAGLATAKEIPESFPQSGRFAKYVGYQPGKARNAGSGLEWVVYRHRKQYTIRRLCPDCFDL